MRVLVLSNKKISVNSCVARPHVGSFMETPICHAVCEENSNWADTLSG